MPFRNTEASGMKMKLKSVALLLTLSVFASYQIGVAEAEGTTTCGFQSVVNQDTPTLWYKFYDFGAPLNYGSAGVSTAILGRDPAYAYPSPCTAATHFSNGGGRFLSTTPLPSRTFDDEIFSIEAIVKIARQTDTAYPTIFNIYSPSSMSALILRVRTDTTNRGKVEFAVFNPSEAGFYSQKTIDDGQWHHLVVTMGQNVMSLYIDGKFDSGRALPTDFGSSLNLDNSPRFTGGSFRSEETLVGEMDEFLIYNRGLTSSEIDSHFKSLQTTSADSSTQQSPNTMGTSNGPSLGNVVAYITAPLPGEKVQFTFSVNVYINPLITRCKGIRQVNLRLDDVQDLVISDSQPYMVPKVLTFEIDSSLWIGGPHTLVPWVQDTCWNAYKSAPDVRPSSIEIKPYISLTATEPANFSRVNGQFKVKLQITGPYAATAEAVGLDFLDTGGSSSVVPDFTPPSIPAIYIHAEFHRSHQYAWKIPELAANNIINLSWSVSPNNWSPGSKRIIVSVRDHVGRLYSSTIDVIVPSKTTVNIVHPSQITQPIAGITQLEARANVDLISDIKSQSIEIAADDLASETNQQLFKGSLTAKFVGNIDSNLTKAIWTVSDVRSAIFDIDTSGWPDGDHKLTVWFVDSTGARAGASTTISTKNPPPSVSVITTPQNDLLQSQALKLSGVVAPTSTAKIASFSISLNNKPISSYPGVKANFATTVTGSNYSVPKSSNSEPSWTIDTSNWTEGNYTLQVSATDTTGRVSSVVNKDFSLYNGKTQAEKRLVYDQVLDEINRSGDGYNDRYAKIQDTIQGIKDKADEALTLIKSVSISPTGTSTFTNTVSARTRQIQIQENSTTKDKGYKYLQPFATNCAQAAGISQQLATDLSTINDRIADLTSRNQNINSLISQLGSIRNDISQNVKELPELPFPVDTPNNWTKLTVAQLTTYLVEIKAANAALLSIQKKALDQRIPDAVMSTIKSKIDDAKSAMSVAREIEAELNANLSNDTSFKALLAKEANYLQGCISKQKLKSTGSSQPAIKVAAPSGKQVPILCTNGIKTTKITGTAPTCPPGYRKI